MSNLRKIKVIKRQNPIFLQTAPKPEEVKSSATQSRNAKRALAKRINDWVFDWREQKREQEFKNTALFT